MEQQSKQDPAQAALKSLEAKVDKLQNDQEQTVSKQYEATVKQYKKEIDDLIAKDENFVTIKEEGLSDAVLQHILDSFHEDGVVLSVEEASKDIEDYLVEQALRMANLTKVKAKLAPPVEEKKTLPPPVKSGLRTLTNDVTSVPTRTHNQSQHLSMSERIKQAIARAEK